MADICKTSGQNCASSELELQTNNVSQIYGTGSIQSTSTTDANNKSAESSANENPQSSSKWQQYKGLIVPLLAALAFAIQVIFIKLLQGLINSNEAAFLRFVMQGMMCLPLIVQGGVSLQPTSFREVQFHVMRSFFGATSLLCEFYAYHKMPAGDATAIVFGAPVFVGIFGKIFLKESFGFFNVIAVITTVAGTVFIANPPFLFGEHDAKDHAEFFAAMVAFLSAILAAIAYVVLRALGLLKVNLYKTVVIYSIGAIFVSSIATTSTRAWNIPQCGLPRFYMVGVGVFNFLGQCLLTYAFSVNNAVIVSIIRANQVIIVMILEVLFLGLVLEWQSIVGTAMILGSVIAVSLQKTLKRKLKIGCW